MSNNKYRLRHTRRGLTQFPTGDSPVGIDIDTDEYIITEDETREARIDREHNVIPTVSSTSLVPRYAVSRTRSVTETVYQRQEEPPRRRDTPIADPQNPESIPSGMGTEVPTTYIPPNHTAIREMMRYRKEHSALFSNNDNQGRDSRNSQRDLFGNLRTENDVNNVNTRKRRSRDMCVYDSDDDDEPSHSGQNFNGVRIPTIGSDVDRVSRGQDTLNDVVQSESTLFGNHGVFPVDGERKRVTDLSNDEEDEDEMLAERKGGVLPKPRIYSLSQAVDTRFWKNTGRSHTRNTETQTNSSDQTCNWVYINGTLRLVKRATDHNFMNMETDLDMATDARYRPGHDIRVIRRTGGLAYDVDIARGTYRAADQHDHDRVLVATNEYRYLFNKIHNASGKCAMDVTDEETNAGEEFKREKNDTTEELESDLLGEFKNSKYSPSFQNPDAKGKRGIRLDSVVTAEIDESSFRHFDTIRTESDLHVEVGDEPEAIDSEDVLPDKNPDHVDDGTKCELNAPKRDSFYFDEFDQEHRSLDNCDMKSNDGNNDVVNDDDVEIYLNDDQEDATIVDDQTTTDGNTHTKPNRNVQPKVDSWHKDWTSSRREQQFQVQIHNHLNLDQVQARVKSWRTNWEPSTAKQRAHHVDLDSKKEFLKSLKHVRSKINTGHRTTLEDNAGEKQWSRYMPQKDTPGSENTTRRRIGSATTPNRTTPMDMESSSDINVSGRKCGPVSSRNLGSAPIRRKI